MSQKLKLVKGMSYTGHGIKATKENPEITVDELMAKALIKSGFFADAGASDSEDPEENFIEKTDELQEEDPVKTITDSLKDKSKAELTEYASKKGIDLSSCKTKAQILDAIVNATLQAKEARKALKGV